MIAWEMQLGFPYSESVFLPYPDAVRIDAKLDVRVRTDRTWASGDGRTRREVSILVPGYPTPLRLAITGHRVEDIDFIVEISPAEQVGVIGWLAALQLYRKAFDLCAIEGRRNGNWSLRDEHFDRHRFERVR